MTLKKCIGVFLIWGILAIVLTGCGSNNTENKNENQNETVDMGNWDTWEVKIDNNVVKLPIEYSYFKDLGFSLSTNKDDEIENIDIGPDIMGYVDSFASAHELTNVDGTYTNGTTDGICISVWNNTDETKKLKDCMVTAIRFDHGEKVGDIKIINRTRTVEAKFGTSKYDELQSRLGTHYKNDNNKTLTFYPDKNKDEIIDVSEVLPNNMVKMVFSDDTGILELKDFEYVNVLKK